MCLKAKYIAAFAYCVRVQYSVFCLMIFVRRDTCVILSVENNRVFSASIASIYLINFIVNLEVDLKFELNPVPATIFSRRNHFRPWATSLKSAQPPNVAISYPESRFSPNSEDVMLKRPSDFKGWNINGMMISRR